MTCKLKGSLLYDFMLKSLTVCLVTCWFPICACHRIILGLKLEYLYDPTIPHEFEYSPTEFLLFNHLLMHIHTLSFYPHSAFSRISRAIVLFDRLFGFRFGVISVGV
ncbi:hypothetical protein EDC01DRAFT_221044 [Geopyxis carbonaria]|nr:hypothetical protein EDC01DRAFT_221044 [Geopyxis carbonaria]